MSLIGTEMAGQLSVQTGTFFVYRIQCFKRPLLIQKLHQQAHTASHDVLHPDAFMTKCNRTLHRAHVDRLCYTGCFHNCCSHRSQAPEAYHDKRVICMQV